MQLMNVKKIREDFPLLLANPDLTYLDSAATSQKPACVLQGRAGVFMNAIRRIRCAVICLSEKRVKV